MLLELVVKSVSSAIALAGAMGTMLKASANEKNTHAALLRCCLIFFTMYLASVAGIGKLRNE